MNIVTHRVEFNPGDVFTLYHITDTHLGSALCDERLLKNDLKAIQDDGNALWGHGGDICEFINRGDPRHRESSMASWLHGKDDIAKVQMDEAVKMFSPISDKCLWLCKGNHEDFILDRYERDVYASMVDAITAPGRRVRLGIQGFVVLLWIQSGKTRWKTTIYTHHGHGGGLLPGGDALSLGRLPTWFNFDIAFVGHRHRKHWLPNTITEPNHRGTSVVTREQYMIMSGSYMNSFDPNGDVESYAELRGLPPKALGCIKVKFYPSSQRFELVV